MNYFLYTCETQNFFGIFQDLRMIPPVPYLILGKT